MKELFVISVGGSLIAPDDVNAAFLKRFSSLIKKQASVGRKFVLIAGGGKTARKYQEAARQAGVKNQQSIDNIGIEATKLNAMLLLSFFSENTYPTVVSNPNEKIKFTQKILVACGWKTGCSSDYDAAQLAKNFGAKQIINLSNIDFVYDKDPRKHKNAKPLIETTWKDYRKIIGDKWKPGLNTPFDPIASKFCEQNKISAVIANGNNMKNLNEIINGRKANCTIIKN